VSASTLVDVGRRAWCRAAGLVSGMLLDAAVGDPRRYHPVSGFGAAAAALERRTYRDSRAGGAAYAAVLVGGCAAAGGAASRAAARHPLADVALTAAATWAVLGGTSLRREAGAMHGLLDEERLPEARVRLSHLCGRDAGGMDAGALARATVESVAENTSDAVVAPLLWGAALGAPGLLAYRAVNTLDAMVGHRSARYARFGWASARLDDLANLAPARLTATLTVVLASVVDGRPAAALRAWRDGAGRHPSPNAGPVEAAFAGALGRTLGGPLSYGGRTELRPRLGSGPPPDPADIARARRLSAAVCTAAGACAVVLAVSRAGRR